MGTIDLCYILYRFNLDFLYTTITMGVDPGYVKENFYDKVLAKDSDRVNQRFSEEKERGIRIQNRRVTSEEIVSHLTETGPVIVLTNANQLQCRKCSPASSISCYPSCFSSSSSYQGHYVVLVGCQDQQLLYRNPTVRDKVCQMPRAALEEARTAYGTDEDVIFIFPTSSEQWIIIHQCETQRADNSNTSTSHLLWAVIYTHPSIVMPKELSEPLKSSSWIFSSPNHRSAY